MQAARERHRLVGRKGVATVATRGSPGCAAGPCSASRIVPQLCPCTGRATVSKSFRWSSSVSCWQVMRVPGMCSGTRDRPPKHSALRSAHSKPASRCSARLLVWCDRAACRLRTRPVGVVGYLLSDSRGPAGAWTVRRNSSPRRYPRRGAGTVFPKARVGLVPATER